jgi:YD repeat-containing protein
MDGTTRTASHTFDARGNATSLSLSSGYYLAYSYDAADRLGDISGAVSFTYDGGGRRSAIGFGGGAGTSAGSYGYDAIGRLTSQTNDLAGTGSDRSGTFAYNPASQMVSRSISNDLYASNSAYNVCRPYSVNGLNQYTLPMERSRTPGNVV